MYARALEPVGWRLIIGQADEAVAQRVMVGGLKDASKRIGSKLALFGEIVRQLCTHGRGHTNSRSFSCSCRAQGINNFSGQCVGAHIACL